MRKRGVSTGVLLQLMIESSESSDRPGVTVRLTVLGVLSNENMLHCPVAACLAATSRLSTQVHAAILHHTSTATALHRGFPTHLVGGRGGGGEEQAGVVRLHILLLMQGR